MRDDANLRRCNMHKGRQLLRGVGQSTSLCFARTTTLSNSHHDGNNGGRRRRSIATRSLKEPRWTIMPSTSTLQQIDMLTYLLGRYPVEMGPTPAAAAEDSPTTPSFGGTRTGTGRSKSKRLEQLLQRSGTQRLATMAADTPASRRVMMIRPFTPLAEVESLVSPSHNDVAEGNVEEEVADEEEEDVVQPLQHPPHLFNHEEDVLKRFGMGGRAGKADVKGFDGIFRQHWRDFHVTEMVVDLESPSGGRELSRSYDYSVPELPSFLGSCDSVEDAGPVNIFEVDAVAGSDELAREAAAYAPSMTADTTNDTAESRLQKLRDREVELDLQETSSSSSSRRSSSDRHRHAKHYLACTLHKQHTAHSVALSRVSQVLRVHPHDISVAGIKDYIGDTVQKVHIANISPTAALAANREFKQRQWNMTLSDFSYERLALTPGDLFGNAFNITLREVHAPRAVVETALESFRVHGFPNYYGCQRFSWFGGATDPGFALLRQNWLVFAFRFLNYTDTDRSLRELLQRRLKYPHPVQDAYRRCVVRRLRQISVEPNDLNVAPFLSCPPLSEPVAYADGTPLNKQHELIVWQLREAYFELQPQSRRLTAQRLSSYLWNQVLTLRLHHFGSEGLLLGDMVSPASLRCVTTNSHDRRDAFFHNRDTITEENINDYTKWDVLHPGVSFDGIALPNNQVADIYKDVCSKYGISWNTRLRKCGIRDFREPPRPILRQPINLRYSYEADEGVLKVHFALERGCYANVAISELMRLTHCAGSDKILTVPAPESLWEGLGSRDPGYVTTFQDLYEGYEDGVGFVEDPHEVPRSEDTALKVWDHEGPLFLPEEEDPVRRAHRWGTRNLIRNMRRRELDERAMAYQLFEKPLAERVLAEGAVGTYAGHTVPLAPNDRGKKVFFQVLRRKKRYAGAPRMTPRPRRGAQVANRNHALPSFRTLSRDTWNVTW